MVNPTSDKGVRVQADKGNIQLKERADDRSTQIKAASIGDMRTAGGYIVDQAGLANNKGWLITARMG